MGLTIADTYYLKAKASSSGGYYNDWNEACEALNYALSYDENHCASWCLLGEIYAKHLGLYEEAFACFDKVIAIDYTYEKVYKSYIKYLIWANKIERAEKLIAYAFTLKETGKAPLFWLSSYIEEIKGNYTTCFKLLKKAKKYTYNEDYFYFIEDEEKRIKKKVKLSRTKKKIKITSKKE